MLSMLKLITRSPKVRTDYPILKDSVVIGRNPDCDIHLDEGAVSRIHARLKFDGNRFTITDLRSSNGTFVNDQQITAPTAIYDGDKIRFSDLDFIFYSDVPEAKRLSPSERIYSVGSAILDESLSKDSINFTSQIDLRNLDHLPIGTSSQRELLDRIQMLQNRLGAMVSLMKNLGKVTTVEEFLPEFFRNTLQLFPQADLAAILVPDEKTGKLKILAHQLRDQFTESPVRIGRTIPQYVFGTEKAILSDDPSCDPRFVAGGDDSILRKDTYSAMAAPVLEGPEQRPIGVILVDSRTGSAKFTKNDLELLTSISKQVAFYHENLEFQKNRRLEEAMAREMELAHQVQKGILPFRCPDFSGYSFFDHYRSAKFVGGDYYDFIPLSDGRLAVVLADVSGKGMPAALQMAKLSSDVRTSLILEKDFIKAVERVNKIYSDPHWDYRFVTMVLAVLEPEGGVVHLVNAGHLDPILVQRDGEPKLVGEAQRGFPLGVVPEPEYKESRIILQSRESLLLMSDGITDAMNEENEPFGNERVLKYLQQAGTVDPETAGRGLLAKIQKYAGEAPQTDDQCLVVIGRN